jgi:hypothetical protein
MGLIPTACLNCREKADWSARHDKNAKKWLIPNAFGAVCKEESLVSIRERIRQDRASAPTH